MTLLSDNAELDMRRRILVVAERLFRQLGYQKTTVADIAKGLQMSPANVYRFFDSKKAIHEGVARHLMGEVEQAVVDITAASGSATERLRKLLSTVHCMNCERYVGDEKLHEMVAIAMEQNWEVCVSHMDRVTGAIGELIAEGVRTGEFEVSDVTLAANCACTAMTRYFHPQMIAERFENNEPTLDQMIEFVLGALGAGKRAAAAG